MLKIRTEQLEALREPVRRRFEDLMVSRLTAAFPARLGVLGEASLRSFIRLGIEKAALYRITAAPQVGRFIEHMARHGADFDDPSGLPGAADVLSDPSLDAAAKLKRLDEKSAARLGG